MKVKIILAIVWASLCLCERQQRSTVLTDEYKRVLEHFDFSNFDKQEALNYIDRQRYENLIRGKRSHSKLKRDHRKAGKITDVTFKENDLSNNIKIIEAVTPNSKFPICERLNYPKHVYGPESFSESCTDRDTHETPNVVKTRNKRGHHGKKKHRSKYIQSESDLEEEDEEDDDEVKYRRHRKRKKKKKRKRHYWDDWSEWSPCSVTCGRGRKIRWRKCIVKNCTTGELEMGEKTCQLPACNLLTKLLGL